jgi:hypothetical protein
MHSQLESFLFPRGIGWSWLQIFSGVRDIEGGTINNNSSDTAVELK